MNNDVLSVHFLGNASIEWNGNTLTDSNNRSRKSWMLLAYLLYNKSKKVKQSDLVRVLWEIEDRYANPYNALKTLLHRTRTMLNELEDQLGHNLIIFKKGLYSISSDYTIDCDVDRFDAAVSRAKAASDEQRYDLLAEAVELYTGDFLNSFSIEQWVIPINVYYHELFVDSCVELADHYYENEKYDECLEICQKALRVEPYDENLYLYLLRCYNATGDNKRLKIAYEKLKDMLYSNFGALPDEEASTLYRNACNIINNASLSFEAVIGQLQEAPINREHKALVCDYDLFKLVYRVGARQIGRSGDVIHVALFNITSKDGTVLSKRSLDKAMHNLELSFGSNLRTGDIIARCSSAQFVVMLPQSNYENSCMVCNRLISAYHRKYPHSPAAISFEVRALAPQEQ